MNLVTRKMKTGKTKFILLNIRKNFIPTLFVLFAVCLVLFSKDNLAAAKNGLLLWANSVVPALLPFFIATELLGYTNVISSLGKLMGRVMRPLFNVPGEGAFAFIMGIVSGYPIGAKIVTRFREEGTCTKEECERLLAFTNNSGPLFILGTVGISLFADTKTGILLLITHILACISVGLIFRFWKRNTKTALPKKSASLQKEKKQLVTFSNLGEVLANSITSAISTIVMIGGFVVLFSVVISILEQSRMIELSSNFLSPIFKGLGISSQFSTPVITGLLELTNGVKQVAGIAVKAISTNITLCAFLLGFGGVSVLLQVFSIISKTDISIFPYLLGKLLQGSLAALYTYLAIHSIPFFNMDLSPAFSPISSALYFGLGSGYSILLVLIALTIFYFTLNRYSRRKRA